MIDVNLITSVSFSDEMRRGEEDTESIDIKETINYIWKEQSADDNFLRSLSEVFDSSVHQFKSSLINSTDECSNFIISCIQKAASSMKGGLRNECKTGYTQPVLWDKDYKNSKILKYEKLKRFRNKNDQESLETFLTAKKEFKNLCQSKKREFNNKTLQELNEACNQSNSKIF